MGTNLTPDIRRSLRVRVQQIVRQTLGRARTLVFLSRVHLWFTILSFAQLRTYGFRTRFIDARRIGHLIWQTENLAKSLESASRTDFCLLIWGPVSNEFTAGRLRDYCNKQGIISLQTASRRVASVIGKRGSRLCGLPLLEPVPGLETFVMERPTIFHLTREDSQECVRFLRSIGFNPDLPFVCVHNRTAAYLLNHLDYEDSSRNDYRNFPIEDMRPAIKSLVDAGLGVIRTGRSSDDGLDDSHQWLLDLTKYPNYPGALDHFVGANALFYLGADSGGVEFSAVSSTPPAFVNYTSFGILGQLRPSGTLPLLPQMVICGRCQCVISLPHSFAMGLGVINSVTQLEQRGVSLRKSRPDEIEALAAECLRIVRPRTHEHARQEVGSDDAIRGLNEEFRSIIKEETGLTTSPSLQVASAFLAEHPYWITGRGDRICHCLSNTY